MDMSKNVSKLSSDGATLAKVIATFSVVLTHSYKLFGYMSIETSKVFYLRGFHAFASCGVPVFFLLSGYFLVFKGNLDYGKNLKKKFRSLVIPYILFMLIYAIISCVGSLFLPKFFDDFRQFTVNEWAMHLFGIPFVTGPQFYGPLWFVRDLFILNLLSFILVPLVKRTPGYLLIPAMIAVYFLPIGQIIRYSIPFFVVGIHFGFKKRIPVLKNWMPIIILLIIGFTVPVFSLSDLAWKVSVFLMAAFIVMASEKLIENEKIVKMAKTAIPFSFPIYMLHEYPITTLMRLLALKQIPMTAAVTAFFIAPFLIILFCVVLIVIWKRTLPKTFSLLTGGRY